MSGEVVDYLGARNGNAGECLPQTWYCREGANPIGLPMAITVGVLKNRGQIREGLATLINGSPGYSCVATCATAEEGLRILPHARPDVVLMDIHLPGMSGIEAVKRLKELLPDTQIMMLTVFEDDEKIFHSLIAGATGYVLEHTSPAELLDAIRILHSGGSR